MNICGRGTGFSSPRFLEKAMKEYNPDSTWQRAQEQQEETAGKRKTK